MNALSRSDVFVEDRLFATLDATARRVELSPAQTIILIDTVGFIRKLPTHLIASFKTTLAEVTDADLLLHIVDASHPQFEEHMAIVQSTLEELDAHTKPTILVFNKIDLLADHSILAELPRRYPNSVCTAAARMINLRSLEEKILERLEADVKEEVLSFPQADYGIISKIHEMAEVLEQTYEDSSVTIRFRLNKRNSARLQKLLARRKTHAEN